MIHDDKTDFHTFKEEDVCLGKHKRHDIMTQAPSEEEVKRRLRRFIDLELGEH